MDILIIVSVLLLIGVFTGGVISYIIDPDVYNEYVIEMFKMRWLFKEE